jgi:mRNA-degrading endonuclease HigB of HigAB toxin-antitoxin module
MSLLLKIDFHTECFVNKVNNLFQDLNTKLCKKTGKACSGNCSKPKLERPVHMVLRDAQWFKPTTLKQLYDLLDQFKDKSVRLVFGSTGSGMMKLFFFYATSSI